MVALQHNANDDVRNVDSKSRLVLPKAFANAMVKMREISETQVLIEKVILVPVHELPQPESALQPLSDCDRDLFLSALENPPAANATLQEAARKYKQRNESLGHQ